jgi:hypothetical protein
MKIEISQDEIELAIRNYVQALGITRPVEEINFVNGRNPPMTSANIELAPLAGSAVNTAKPRLVGCEAVPKETVATATEEEIAVDGTAVAEEVSEQVDDSNEEMTSMPSKGSSLFGS